jgi:hypothetical protein
MLKLPARSSKKMIALNHLACEAVIAAANGRWLSFSRSRDHYARIGQRYHGAAYTYAHIVQTVDELVRAGLLEEERARPGDHLRTGLQSRVRATPALIAVLKQAPLEYSMWEPIRLRNVCGELIQYPETQRTRQMRRRLAPINNFLSGIDVRLHDVLPAPILCRVFNRSSWMKGGRLYTGLQNLSATFAVLRVRYSYSFGGSVPLGEPLLKRQRPSTIASIAGGRPACGTA